MIVGICLFVLREVGFSWAVSSTLSAAALIGVWRFLASQSGTKDKGIEAFPEFVRDLCMAMENGAVLTIKHRNSDVEFLFVRISGEGIEATAELQVPRASWSMKNSEKIESAFEAQGFEFRKDESMSGLTYIVTLKIPNVWDAASGATAAHAARTLILAAGLDENSRFDARYDGMTSKRILEAKDRQL